MLITRSSPFSGVTTTKDINVTEDQMTRWEKGEELIQDVMGHLSADDREFIMSGLLPHEWDELYKE